MEIFLVDDGEVDLTRCATGQQEQSCEVTWSSRFHHICLQKNESQVTCKGLSPVDGQENRRQDKVLHVNGHVPRDIYAIVACFPRDVLCKVVKVGKVQPPSCANRLLESVMSSLLEYRNNWSTILTLGHLTHHLMRLRPSSKVFE